MDIKLDSKQFYVTFDKLVPRDAQRALENLLTTKQIKCEIKHYSMNASHTQEFLSVQFFRVDSFNLPSDILLKRLIAKKCRSIGL